jgi:hypothetical protein
VPITGDIVLLKGIFYKLICLGQSTFHRYLCYDHFRKRSIIVEASGGGAACSGPIDETRQCFKKVCGKTFNYNGENILLTL